MVAPTRDRRGRCPAITGACRIHQEPRRIGVGARDLPDRLGPARPRQRRPVKKPFANPPDRRSEEHTSELQSLMRISYAVFCLKKKKTSTQETHHMNNINSLEKVAVVL